MAGIETGLILFSDLHAPSLFARYRVDCTISLSLYILLGLKNVVF